MKRIGIVSYNMYGNFTNYGSALQSYALQAAINKIAPGEMEAVVVDYCPDVLADKNILNPIENMWDKDEAARERCRLSLPAIHENYKKFNRFYSDYYNTTSRKYTSSNFNNIIVAENLSGFVCGSDTVFAVPEFGFDDGFYASYPVMRDNAVAYAASFGDYDIEESQLPELKKRLNNFKAIALRESDKKELVESLVDRAVYKVIDPTLLLTPHEYNSILEEPDISEPYLLLYSRRGDEKMQNFAERIAQENGLKIVEISLNAQNAPRHIMRYDAGVEEFLGLVKNASLVVTNSFHGMIFAVQFKRPFYVFSRKLCDTKIQELLDLLGLQERLISESSVRVTEIDNEIDYDEVHRRIDLARGMSVDVLASILETL